MALAHDGADLPAALQTIREIGPEAFWRAIDDAFRGSRLDVVTRAGRFELAMLQHGMLAR